jgi:hypothetical protein
MRQRFPDLPDAFVERVKVLELKLEFLEKEIINVKSAHTNHRRETKRIIEVTQLFRWIPGGPKAFFGVILSIIFFSSLTAEILLKTTNFHVTTKKQIIEFLGTD